MPNIRRLLTRQQISIVELAELNKIYSKISETDVNSTQKSLQKY